LMGTRPRECGSKQRHALWRCGTCNSGGMLL
jgi:hypothetical protein